MATARNREQRFVDLAHLLANDPAYVNRPLKDFARATAMSNPQVPETISDFRAAVAAAQADLTKALEAACGDTVAVCARQDVGRFNASAMNEAFYATTQTYGLATVHPEIADKVEDVGALAPEAGNLLTAAFPELEPRGGEPHPDRDGRSRAAAFSTTGSASRRLFPAQPLCGCRPRGGALARQALKGRGFNSSKLELPWICRRASARLGLSLRRRLSVRRKPPGRIMLRRFGFAEQPAL